MRRQAIDIDADILRTIKRCGPRTGITAIVYGANLNFIIVRKYLKRLIDRGLIISEEMLGSGRVLYTNTEKAPEFLGVYEDLGVYLAPQAIQGVNQ